MIDDDTNDDRVPWDELQPGVTWDDLPAGADWPVVAQATAAAASRKPRVNEFTRKIDDLTEDIDNLTLGGVTGDLS